MTGKSPSDQGAKTDRPRIAAMERGPGPARYSLPGMTGSTNHDCRKRVLPAYSFGLRLGTSFIRDSKTPGPNYLIDPALTRYGRDGTASYSVYSRPKDLEPFRTPGPAAYAPEKYNYPYSPRTPAYSIGLRTRFRKRDNSPSPSSYTLPAMLGNKVVNRASSATFVLTGRSNLGSFDTDYAKTPGPARYGVTSADIHQRKSPAYSMLSRRFMPGDNTKKPGPGAHSPERSQMTKRSPPAYSMGIKHSEYVCPLIIDVSD